MNVSPDTRFDEATPAQFREFWEAQGWRVEECYSYFFAYKNCANGTSINVGGDRFVSGGMGLGEDEGGEEMDLKQRIATFGEALRYANNLAQAELFGGWAE